MILSEEMRYKVQKMLWDRLWVYLFGSTDGHGHSAWRGFLEANNIVLLPGKDASRHDGGAFVLVCSPMERGALMVPMDLAMKTIVLGGLPN